MKNPQLLKALEDAQAAVEKFNNIAARTLCEAGFPWEPRTHSVVVLKSGGLTHPATKHLADQLASDDPSKTVPFPLN